MASRMCAQVYGDQNFPFSVAVEVNSVGLPREWYFIMFRLSERGGWCWRRTSASLQEVHAEQIALISSVMWGQ
jgi:hypothetical protein